MQIIETYGKYIEKWANTNPDRARVLLKLGWEVQNLKYKFTPNDYCQQIDILRI